MQVSTLLTAAGDSHPGVQRRINEDRYHYDPARGLFIVVDGVGGQAAGEKAAETALATLRKRLERETGPIEDRVREAIALANDEIHRLASTRAEWKGMACVLTVAVVVNGDVVVGHVGDTRLYKLRGGGIEKITRDHSPVGEREEAGELSELDAMHHPRRNEVYRDVGSEPHAPGDPQFIDLFRASFEADAALLLCSDGLTDAVTSSTIAAIVGDHAGHPAAVTRALIEAANDAGGKDNVTVVYAEGPRFARGEETRDLRRRSTEPPLSPPAPVPAVSASRRWRLWGLTVLLLTVVGLAAYSQRHRWPIRPIVPGSTTAATTIVVPGGSSIAEAISRAEAGTEVVVEPGEYRERLRLKEGVRVVSRVSRGAWIRLPGGASETDAAVVAFDITDAAFSGFRIIGDAATPLGTGIVVRNSAIAIADVEVTGAQTAAIEYSVGGGGSLLAAYLHDNPGVAIIVRSGGSPHVAHSAFLRNATSVRAAGPLLIEADAGPVWTSNTFHGVRPESIVLPRSVDPAAFQRDNWFIVPVEPSSGRGKKKK